MSNRSLVTPVISDKQALHREEIGKRSHRIPGDTKYHRRGMGPVDKSRAGKVQTHLQCSEDLI